MIRSLLATASLAVLWLSSGNAPAPTPRCAWRGYLPDPLCTPGRVETVDRAVICGQSSHTRRHVPESAKRAALAGYGVRWEDRVAYVVDHRVPLECGGSNESENLWPEPVAEAREKDVLEGTIHRAICEGTISPEEGQRFFLGDWML